MNRKVEKQIVLNAISEITGMEITPKLEEAVAAGLREIRCKKFEESQEKKKKWKEQKNMAWHRDQKRRRAEVEQ